MSNVQGSSNQEYGTPDEFWEKVNEEFQFKIDVAASAGNRKCEFYIDQAQDALNTDWFTPSRGIMAAWCNPPYAKPIPWLVQAAYQTRQYPGSVAVVLLNHDASTKAYEFCLAHAHEVRILTGARISFIGPDGKPDKGNPRGQALYVFRAKQNLPALISHWDWLRDLKEKDHE